MNDFTHGMLSIYKKLHNCEGEAWFSGDFSEDISDNNTHSIFGGTFKDNKYKEIFLSYYPLLSSSVYDNIINPSDIRVELLKPFSLIKQTENVIIYETTGKVNTNNVLNVKVYIILLLKERRKI